MGMVSKKYGENDVRAMFQHFGTIEECTVLRDNNGISKGDKLLNYTGLSSSSPKLLQPLNSGSV